MREIGETSSYHSTLASTPTATSTRSSQFSKRRGKYGNDKNGVAEDEFMAASIGDVEWLKQSLRGKKGINLDLNVSIL